MVNKTRNNLNNVYSKQKTQGLSWPARLEKAVGCGYVLDKPPIADHRRAQLLLLFGNSNGVLNPSYSPICVLMVQIMTSVDQFPIYNRLRLS